ncbi:MAG: S41 family peptidase [Victivallales bacterium]|nr:S41 family peptidase [Victivallales bacterium]
MNVHKYTVVLLGMCWISIPAITGRGGEDNPSPAITIPRNDKLPIEVAPPAGIKTKLTGAAADQPYRELAKLTSIMELLHRTYVDKDKASYHRLIQGALHGMLQELDPFSSYHSAEELARFLNHSEGRFVGIGILLSWRNGNLEVETLIHDSPAWQAGLRPGDVIVGIDGTAVNADRPQAAIARLSGPIGSKIKIVYLRPPEPQRHEVEITRADISGSPVPPEGVRVIDGSIGYIRLLQFPAATAEELDRALAKLKQQKITALILDLRSNPGGLLVSAVQVCSRFLATGSEIVRTSGRNPAEDVAYRAQSCDKETSLPLVILIDGHSASAAEIVAGCLKDHHRAVLVGTKSYGKGSVQRIARLPDRSGIRYTVALYYTPSKRVIHGHGIAPDIVVPLTPQQQRQLARQLLRSPGVIRPDYDGAVEDTQLRRAVEILHGINLISSRR